MAKVHLIALTDGPCAGKTTALQSMKAQLAQDDWQVLILPEVATILARAGMDKHALAFQSAVAQLQLQLENSAYGYVHQTGADTVILADRGLLDGIAYTGREHIKEVLEACGLNLTQATHRYHGIIHMVTAADGAREHYGNQTNAIRDESPERAIELDRAIQEAWRAHPRWHPVDNSGNFQNKLLRTRQALSNIIASVS